LSSAEIVFVQESLHLTAPTLFPRFMVYHVPAVVTSCRPSGGLVTLLRRDSFGSSTIEVVVAEQHLLAVLVRWASFSLLLCNVYAPLSNGGDAEAFFTELEGQLASLSYIYTPSSVIVAGDFNAHLFRPKDACDKEFLRFVSTMKTEAYSAYPKRERPYTYVSGKSFSTIDYCFVRGINVSRFKVHAIAVAQHRPLELGLSLPDVTQCSASQALGTAYWKSKTKQRNFPDSLAVLGSVVHSATPSGFQRYYDQFSNLLSLATKRTTRKQAVESWECFLPPTDIAELHELRADVATAAGQADNDEEARARLAVKRKRLEQLTTTLMKKALDAETNRLAETAESHTDAWKVLSKLRKPFAQCPIPTDRLYEHFASLMKPPSAPLLPAPLQSAPASHQDFEPLQPEEVVQAMNDVNRTSAAGPDGIPPRLMCQTFATGPAFEFLFNLLVMCLVLAYVPLQWREAVLFALYKGSGDPCDPNNYRAIALTSSFGKLYERVLLQRLLRWLKKSRLWLLPQFGFRAGCSCLHAVFLLRAVVLDVLTTGNGPVYAAFVDLKKAFPSVGRDALFERMTQLGIPSPLVLAIRSFYVANVARLRIDNTITRDFFVVLGVLEGSVLSPCLFGILFSVIWDLFSTTPFPTIAARIYNCDSVWFIAYADDLVVLTLSASKLEHVLNKMAVELRKLNLEMRCDIVAFTYQLLL
jgi:hypothetical protein